MQIYFCLLNFFFEEVIKTFNRKMNRRNLQENGQMKLIFNQRIFFLIFQLFPENCFPNFSSLYKSEKIKNYYIYNERKGKQTFV